VETSKISPNVSNLAMPRGKLSFAPVNDSGVMTGEVDLGNVESLDLTNAIAYKEHLTSHDSVVVLDAKKPSEQKWNVKFVPDEVSAENMAMFFLGDPDKCKDTGDRLSQTGGSTIATVDYYMDRWLDLGKKYIKPDSDIVITCHGGSETIHPTASGNFTEYAIDLENGLLMIKQAMALPDSEGNPITVDFLYGTCSLKKFVPRIRPLVGFMRYRGVSEVGPRHAVEMWKVQITPDAALNLVKPSDYAKLGFSGDVFIDDDTGAHRATDPFFKVYELDKASSYPLS